MVQPSNGTFAINRSSEILSNRIMVSKETVATFRKRRRIVQLSLFGSALRDEFSLESDIDQLVEFELGGVPRIDFISIVSGLSHSLGQPLDSLTQPAVERSQNQLRRKLILDSVEVTYASR